MIFKNRQVLALELKNFSHPNDIVIHKKINITKILKQKFYESSPKSLSAPN